MSEKAMQGNNPESNPDSPSWQADGRPRNNRRRARRACLACRARKVRCDVVERFPCGNCRWDNSDCVVVRRRGGKCIRVNPPNEKPSRLGEHKEASTDTDADLTMQDGPLSRKLSNAAVPVSNCGLSEDMEYSSQMLNLLTSYTGDHGTSLDSRPSKPHEQPQPQTQSPLDTGSQDSPYVTDLPGFIKPLAAGIETDDLAYLQSKGALKLPAEEFQNALLWSFFEYVYPFMPVVDLEEFLQSVHDREGDSGQISLLLFQAVLFAGTAHVSMDYLAKAGFHDRREARKAFFQRVRLLYDFNTETDQIILVQAILLMTLWYETPKEHRNTWHWIDVAISQAFSAGLHREPSFLSSPPMIRVQRLRRRLWWSCLIRDRLVSLGMKRPPRINDEDFCVPMLEKTDFEPDSFLDVDHRQLRDMCSYIGNKTKRATLARLCIAKASLCHRLKYYLRSRYSVFIENAGDEMTEASKMSRPNDQAAFISCSEDLVAWQDTLPEICKYRPLSHDALAQVDNTIALHRIILHMIYYASISALHRSRFTLLLHDQSSSLFDQEVSKVWMQHAAIRVSDMAGEVHQHGFDGLLPTLSLSVMVSAASVHLLEVRGVIEAERKRAFEGYRRCMIVIDSLADMYVAADLAKDAMDWSFIQPSNQAGTSSEVDSMLQSSQSPTATDNSPLDIDSLAKSYDPLDNRLLHGKNHGSTDDDQCLEISGTSIGSEWLGYPALDLGNFENGILFSDVGI
ncbi:Cutinase transcription factor 1 beta [Fusarium albosuccineum]|uniref:Cutinase transcription factor 1 beta n=1 Tax=Fusarium albosuccineum TaxID=1237068 RepID=A0A8H4LPN4_9HYPO|nr:Cutinase transcription factor 1 beta [Fusarium albosuccineum]